MGLFSKLGEGFAATQRVLTEGIETLFRGRPTLHPETLNQLETLLLSADLGPEAVERLISQLKETITRGKSVDIYSLKKVIKSHIITLLDRGKTTRGTIEPPEVTLFMGINGSGKTTTIGKLAEQQHQKGKKTILAAADTFRAAAAEQLVLWGERTHSHVVRGHEGADPASIAFDAACAARARLADCLFIDTAGRLQTKQNLMEELKKITRVVGKAIPGAPHEKILILDATGGLNAISQARHFHESVGVTGLILTKLDSTARGGSIIPIVEALSVPVLYVGVGEAAADLLPFDPNAFADALLDAQTDPPRIT